MDYGLNDRLGKKGLGPESCFQHGIITRRLSQTKMENVSDGRGPSLHNKNCIVQYKVHMPGMHFTATPIYTPYSYTITAIERTASSNFLVIISTP